MHPHRVVSYTDLFSKPLHRNDGMKKSIGQSLTIGPLKQQTLPKVDKMGLSHVRGTLP